jgi:hypothetical protein
MKVIRLETPQQGVDVEDLAEQLHDELGETHAFDRRAICEACYNCVSDPQRTQVNCWIAYDDNHHPLGFLAGTIHRSFYSYRKFATQEMWYVVPGARRSHAATQLLLAYEEWALDHKVERIYTQVEHDNEPLLVERIFRLMQYLGYKKQGYIAVKRPQYDNLNEDKDNDRTTHRGVGAEQAQV